MRIYFSPQLLSEYNFDQVSSAVLDRDLSAKRTFGLRRRWGRQVEGIYLPALEWFSKGPKDGRENHVLQCACAESYAANATAWRRRNMSREVLPRDKQRTAALGMVMALKEMVKGVLYSLKTWEMVSSSFYVYTEQQVRPGPGQAAGLERALCRRGVRGITQTASVVFQ